MSLTTMQKTATTVVLVGVVLVGVGLVSYWSTKLAAGVLQPPDNDDKTPTTSQPPTSPLLWDQTHGQFIQVVNGTSNPTEATLGIVDLNDTLLRRIMDGRYPAVEPSNSGKIRVSRASAGNRTTRPWTRRPKRFIFRTVELNNTRLAHE